jgi:hypothetical protein
MGFAGRGTAESRAETARVSVIVCGVSRMPQDAETTAHTTASAA